MKEIVRHRHPINQLFYKDMATTEYIKDCLTSLQKELPLEAYNRILLNALYTHGNT